MSLIMVDPEHIFSKAKSRNKGCLFCDPIEGMTLLETDTFRVLIDNFPIAPGHLMISTKAHFAAAGELLPEIREEFIALKDKVGKKLKGKFGSVIFYEHGRLGGCSALDINGENCEHFHFHCLPVDISIHFELKKHMREIPLNGISDIFNVYESYGRYLYFEDSEGNASAYLTEKEIPAHYLRSLVCKALNVDVLSDWKEFSDISLFEKSFNIMRGLFTS